ncbi:hypothetical protein LSH36_491g01045 [Paralvinella palmiformis]|uniref:Uncharacterized protein n=1 Tax=Paralvinella palmiformis TaxID=53620 RepID=A0AAD9MYN9_9ANNE|nr:hypothetical protein LSH36_491g01045 [Paralvinella palmiformis]
MTHSYGLLTDEASDVTVVEQVIIFANDSDNALKSIKDTVENLTIAWKFFEYSPPRTALFIHVQQELLQLQITKKNQNKLSNNICKACRTRWLSIAASVESVLQHHLAMVNTYRALKDEQLLALGLLIPFHSSKMLGLLYILHAVLPIMCNLSRVFQTSALNYSLLQPAINHAETQLNDLDNPVETLVVDLAAGGKYAQAELMVTETEGRNTSGGMFQKYTNALIENIDDRFAGNLEILEAFHVFDPTAVPGTTESSDIKEYGEVEIEKIGCHFYQNDETLSQKLKDEWHNLLAMKALLPKEVKKWEVSQTPVGWMLTKICVSISSQRSPS